MSYEKQIPISFISLLPLLLMKFMQECMRDRIMNEGVCDESMTDTKKEVIALFIYLNFLL